MDTETTANVRALLREALIALQQEEELIVKALPLFPDDPRNRHLSEIRDAIKRLKVQCAVGDSVDPHLS